MTDISLCFEVHQPFRLKKSFFWEGSSLRKAAPGELFNFYFDEGGDHEIFDRVTSKCYLPANRIILEEIRRFEETEKPFKVAYSLSGVLLEQCMRYSQELLDSFAQLVDTGLVEVMEQTYYHSLSSLYEDKSEFEEQVKMHRDLVWDLFGTRPETFENTELLYNDEIAGMAQRLGYKAIFTEGIIADPNYVYRPEGTEIALLLRNYQLTDDVGFRFSSRSWEEYPLTADKYSAWLSVTPGKCINLFCDYETFGEHQWPETGIMEFLRYLPREVLKWDNLRFRTPKEIASDILPERTIGVKNTVSWADIERGTSSWLGNALQWACYTYEKRLEAPIKESQDRELLDVWRYLGLSDHLYYIFTTGGGPGEVHSYFSPYNNAYDAAVTLFSILSDLHCKLKERFAIADEPFRFALGPEMPTGCEVYSLKGLCQALDEVEISSIEHHMGKGDLAFWARTSLQDEHLARKIEQAAGLEGEKLRRKLVKSIKHRLESKR